MRLARKSLVLLVLTWCLFPTQDSLAQEGCTKNPYLQPKFAIQPGVNITYRIKNQSNPWWTLDRVAAVQMAFQAWQNVDASVGINTTFQFVNTSAGSTIWVEATASQIPGQSPETDGASSIARSAGIAGAASIFLRTTNLSAASSLFALMLHEIGHYHGLADLPSSLSSMSVMADGVAAWMRRGTISPCDSNGVKESKIALAIGAPPGGGECPVTGCINYGAPCGPGYGWVGDGWCWAAPGYGPGEVRTDWDWYLFNSPNYLPLSSIYSPANGAVLSGPYNGLIQIGTLDQNGRVLRVDYYVNDVYAYTSVQWPFHFPVANGPAGSYKVQAAVYDNRAEGAWSAPIWITVQAPSGGGGGGGGGANILQSGQRLYAWDYRDSPDGRFRFGLQADGNLVHSGPTGPIWATMTFDAMGFLEMQGDGNLVLYNSGSVPIWHSATPYFPGAYLAVQSDGNVVIFSATGIPVWATNTGGW